MPLRARRSFPLGVLVACVIALPVTSAIAGVVRVPADQPTIQLGINASVNGDTVLVAPGTYVENINFAGKAIVVASESGPFATILDANHAGSGVQMVSGEGVSSVFTGFLVRNSGGGFNTAGIWALNSSPTIRGNIVRECEPGIHVGDTQAVVEGNTVTMNRSGGIVIGGGTPLILDNSVLKNLGGGIVCDFSSATIRGNRVRENSGTHGGGIHIGGSASAIVEGNLVENNTSGRGIYLNAAGTPTIRNNVVRGNQGGGMILYNDSNPLIVQNLFVGNHGSGIEWLTPSGARGPRVLNNTFALNNAPLGRGSAIFADGYDGNAEVVGNVMVAPAGQTAFYSGNFNDQLNPRLRYNDVFSLSGPAYGGLATDMTGIDGNISADPIFRNPAGNFRLTSVSPALDAGDNSTYLLDTDLDGQPRLFDADGDGSPWVDMGAYEFNDANQAPVADAGGPYSGDIESPFAFDGGRSYDPDEDPLTYTWNFGDGTVGAGPTPSHLYASLGVYQVILTVGDASQSDSDTTTVEVLNLNKPPVADAGGPYFGSIGQAVLFDGSGSSDPEGDPLSYLWSFGDRSTGTGATPTHAYFYSDQFLVILEVSDGIGVARDSTSAFISYPLADVYSSQSHAPDPAVAGLPLAIRVIVGNLGPMQAFGATLAFSAHGAGYSVTSVNTSQGTCTYDSCCVSCTFDGIAPQDSVRVDIIGIPTSEGTVTVNTNGQSLLTDFYLTNNYSTASIMVESSAIQRITSLIAVVEGYSLRRGTEKTLVDQLLDARTALASQDTAAACSNLEDFRRRVGRFAGRSLTFVQATALEGESNGIESSLGCSDPSLQLAMARRQAGKFSFHLQSGLGSAARGEVRVPSGGSIRMDVFDVQGRLVRRWGDAVATAGVRSVAWDGRGTDGLRVAAGVYFLRVAAGKESAVARFVLIR